MIATTTTGAKVYYLPTAEAIPDTPRESSWTRWRRRALTGWWRVRLSLADIRIGPWPAPRRRGREGYAALLEDVVADSPAQFIDRRPRKPARPAAILDFEAGRLRLRPQAN